MKRRQTLAWPGMLLATSVTFAAEEGAHLYAQSCLACHGADGAGTMPGVRDLTEAEGPLKKPDGVLFRSIRDGVHDADGPLSMPPRGGNPMLTDSDIHLLIDYLRQSFGSTENAAQTTVGEKR